MTEKFHGRTVLVTGAASGLGEATAAAFVEAGANVVAVDRDRDGLDAARERLAGKGTPPMPHVADIAEPEQCAGAIAAAVAAFGGLDVLVNVAGIAQMARVADTSPELWSRILAVNLGGTFFMCQSAIPHLLRAHGSIINVASSAGIQGQAYMTAYCASKSAVIGLTKSMAVEFLKEPIRINAIAPGGIDTPMVTGMVRPVEPDLQLLGRFQGIRKFAQPADVASLILYLASDSAKAVHGACLSIDQGATAG